MEIQIKSPVPIFSFQLGSIKSLGKTGERPACGGGCAWSWAGAEGAERRAAPCWLRESARRPSLPTALPAPVPPSLASHPLLSPLQQKGQSFTLKEKPLFGTRWVYEEWREQHFSCFNRVSARTWIERRFSDSINSSRLGGVLTSVSNWLKHKLSELNY